MKLRLTPPQWAELKRIGKGGVQGMPYAAFWNSMPERKLIEKGLIRRADIKKPLGGGGAIGGCMVTWHLAEVTEEGRELLGTQP